MSKFIEFDASSFTEVVTLILYVVLSERLSRGKNTNVVLSEVDRLSAKRIQLEQLSDDSLTEPAHDVLSELTVIVELSNLKKVRSGNLSNFG